MNIQQSATTKEAFEKHLKKQFPDYIIEEVKVIKQPGSKMGGFTNPKPFGMTKELGYYFAKLISVEDMTMSKDSFQESSFDEED